MTTSTSVERRQLLARRALLPLSFLALGLVTITTSPVSASKSPYDMVYGFQAGGGSIVRLNVTDSRSNAPGCSNPSFPNQWTIDASTAAD